MKKLLIEICNCMVRLPHFKRWGKSCLGSLSKK